MHARLKIRRAHVAARHARLRGPDWVISEMVLDRAIEAIARRRPVCREYDVPYLAGYSQDGTRIYIDKDLPKTWKTGTGQRIPSDRYLLLHEAVEKSLLDTLGLKYQHAHQIALRVEQAAIRADGLVWREYDRFMQRCIKEAGEDPSFIMPPDLDLTPYIDSHDQALVKRMRAVMKRKRA